MTIKEVLRDAIKEKRELHYIDDAIIDRELDRVLTKKEWDGLATSTTPLKTRLAKRIMKDVRAQLHMYYGRYQTTTTPRRAHLFNQYLQDKSMIDDVLKTHASTRERLPIYEHVFQEVFANTGKPSCIIDLASGLNPLALHHYYGTIPTVAVELSQKECDFLNHAFKKLNIPGIARSHDLNHITSKDMQALHNEAKTYAQGDGPIVCLALKTFDITDNKKNEIMLTTLKVDWFIISFSSRTLGNRAMASPLRAGFQKMLRRLGKEHLLMQYQNEIYYLINNQ